MRNKKGGKKDDNRLKYIVLITAIASLIKTLIDLIERLAKLLI